MFLFYFDQTLNLILGRYQNRELKNVGVGPSPLYTLLFLGTSKSNWLLEFDEYVRSGVKYGVATNFLKAGDPIIVVSRWKKSPGFTESVRIL